MLKNSLIIISLSILVACNVPGKKESGFTFQESEQGLELSENGKKVFFYQMAPLAAGDNPEINASNQFNHYIHPLYNLDEKVITEANPIDDPGHPHHRGIFWGWHQLYIDGENVGDSWIMDHIEFDITEVNYSVNKEEAELNLRVQWITTISDQEKAFVEEQTRITTHALQDGKRIIDFEIGLRGLVPNVEIGGSKDTIKGYSGFSARISLSDSMLFLSEKGPVIPITGQVHAGPWVDFSTPALRSPDKFGLTMLCHPSLPTYPPPWLLRSKGSMQNPAFPGFDLALISDKKSTVLRYRLIIHDGNAGVNKIKEWNKEYSQIE